MPSVLSICYSLLFFGILLFANRLYALRRNYVSARALNLPIVVCLESFQDPLWMLFGPSIRTFLSRIGLWDPTATDYTTTGWSQHDRFASHAKYGRAFVIVSPFENHIVVADVEASRELFKNWRSWIKNPALYSLFNAHGPNVNSVNGDDWPRHRKVTSRAFKEANSKLVWAATQKQTAGIISKWRDNHAGDEITLEDARADFEKLALHVLMAAGFGQEYDFETGVKVVEPGHKVSFGEAMHTSIGTMALLIGAPVAFAAARLPSFLIPAGLKKLQVAVEEVRSFLRRTVDNERKALANGKPPTDNLISILVRANEEEKLGAQGKALALTDEELYGNLFMFNMAGHETTASSLSYAVPLLAIYPEIQKWIRDEVDAVGSGNELKDYDDSFPRLVRALAFMYETQRLFPAIPLLLKYSADRSLALTLNGIDTVIPPKTWVSVNINGLHFDPDVWGSDVNEFRPSRWIRNPGSPGEESFAVPDGVEFVGWSSGPRVCPGKRFSQVEFCATISTMLKMCEFRPATRNGESNEQAKERLRIKAFDVEHLISLRPLDPKGAGIVCARRSDS